MLWLVGWLCQHILKCIQVCSSLNKKWAAEMTLQAMSLQLHYSEKVFNFHVFIFMITVNSILKHEFWNFDTYSLFLVLQLYCLKNETSIFCMKLTVPNIVCKILCIYFTNICNESFENMASVCTSTIFISISTQGTQINHFWWALICFKICCKGWPKFWWFGPFQG